MAESSDINVMPISVRETEAEHRPAPPSEASSDGTYQDSFDNLVQLARAICRVPIAVITLVEEGSARVKSQVGLSRPELAEAVAMFGAMILQSGMLVVPDLREDSRFADHPLVRGAPALRFYAGVPLLTAEGRGVGTLGVFDQQARTLTSEQRQALAYVAHQIMLQSALQRTLLQVAGADAAVVRERNWLMQERDVVNAILDTAGSLSVVLDRAGHIVGFNEACEKSTGYRFTDVEGQLFLDILVRPEDRAGIGAQLISVQPDQFPVDYVGNLLTQDGSHRRVKWSTNVLRDPQGAVKYFISVGNDITEHEAAEASRRQSDSQFRTIVESLDEGLLITDLNDRVLYANARIMELSGYTYEELIGQLAYPLLLPPQEWPAVRTRIAQCRAGIADHYTVRMNRKDSTPFWADVHATPLRNMNGEITGTLSALTDITQRRAAEAAIYESEERYRSLFDYSIDAVLLTAPNGYVLAANSEASRIFGASEDQIRRIGLQGLLDSTDPCTVAALAEQARTGRFKGELQFQRQDGTVFSGEVSLASFKNQAGLEQNSLIIRDITERKQAEALLRQAKEAAEAANRAKSQFLSRMSHELRTPLNAILGFSQLLAMDELTGDQQDALADIIKAGRHLLALINEVLDLGRIESGHLDLALDAITIRDVVRESWEMVAPLASQRAITLEVAYGGYEQQAVQADRQRLKQVLLNLLSNAVKYNREAGHVLISCAAGSASRLRIAVQDTGPGIATDVQDRLFIPFDRLGAEYGEIEGTGLGLTVARHLATAMNGTLGVASTLGQGSTFWIELPLATDGDPQPAGSVDHSVGPVSTAGRILYIEDNLPNLKLVEHILRRASNVELLTAPEGQRGLELAQRHHPDLILLDLHLPDLPGDEVLRRLQAAPTTRTIPVIVISADVVPKRVAALLAAGAQGYLTKPLEVHAFLATVKDILDKGASD
ncbi:MAG TPA: PAS domain S-box protein [Chloroflexia bacterium]|jgi:PAS domain S-box-containing protein|nr:PAS domain S-box protein [Chloroflexia bacterium]